MVFGGVRKSGSIQCLSSSVITFEEGRFERGRVATRGYLIIYSGLRNGRVVWKCQGARLADSV